MLLGMYWRVASFPELGHLSPDERAELLRGKIGFGYYFRLVARSAAFGAVVGIATAVMLPPQRSLLAAVASAGAALGAAVATYGFTMLRIRVRMREEIRKRCLGRRVPACLKCGYDLRTTTEDRCPECGEAIRVPQARR